VNADSEFAQALAALIARVEAWTYAESDSGGRLAEEVGEGLAALARRAPSGTLRHGLLEARDALDDGLPAERVAAALYAVQRAADIDHPPPRGASG
jgi:hypothetical protein